MSRGLAIFLVLIVAVGAGLFVVQESILDVPLPGVETGKRITKAVVEKAKKVSIATPPLIAEITGIVNVQLQDDQVFMWTNIRRAGEEISPAFSPSGLLNSIARARLNDMFTRQYFDHYAPDGTGVADVATQFGYDYITIGENIALGNVLSEEEMVQLWMDSPPHYENIVSNKYTELGVAVGRGTFGGSETWIGVQIFARPLSECNEPSAVLFAAIETKELQVENLKEEAAGIRATLNAMKPTIQNQSEYNALVDEYNALASEINKVVAVTKKDVERYNNEVRNFNECINTHQ